MGLPRNCEGHVQIVASGNHWKYGTYQAPWKFWLSSSPTHSRPLETQHSSNNLHPRCRWFRNQIRIKTRFRPSPPSPSRQVHHFYGLGRILIHRNHVGLQPHHRTCWLIHAKMCRQSITQVQISSPKIQSRQKARIFSTQTRWTKLWSEGSICRPHRGCTPFRLCLHQFNTKNCRHIFILWDWCWQHDFSRPRHHCL